MFAKTDSLPRLDDGFLSSRQRYLMEPPNKAHIGTKGFFSFKRGCPLFRDYKCIVGIQNKHFGPQTASFVVRDVISRWFHGITVFSSN